MYKLLVTALLLFSCTGVKAQSLLDIFKGTKVGDTITAVTGEGQLTDQKLAGTWKYVKPAVELNSDNLLNNAAGAVATTQIENKLGEQCAKVGIKAGLFSYTFNTDKTFTCNVGGKSLKGTYEIDAKNSKITLKFGALSKIRIGTMTAEASLTGSSLSLLFEADKLLSFITKLSSYTKNSTVSTLSSLAKNYDGMKLGFELQK